MSDAQKDRQQLLQELEVLREQLGSPSAPYFTDSERALYDELPTALLLIDSGGHLLDMNHAAQTLFGYSAAELPATHFDALCEAPDQFAGLLEQIAGQTIIKKAAIQFKKRSGFPFTGLLTLAPRTDPAGQVSGYRGMVHNVIDQRHLEDALYFTAQQGTSSGSDGFLQSLVRYLAESLAADYAFVGQYRPQKNAIHTVALYADGAIAENLSYTLPNTPCANVVDQQLCCYPANVQDLFPEDELLVEMEAECYIGMPLWDSTGHPLGIIVVIGRTPLTNPDIAQTLLRIVAMRVSQEMEHREHVARLRTSEARYHSVFENLPVSLWEEDFSGVKQIIDRLHAEGVTDFRSYFEANPGLVTQCVEAIRILDVNQATLDLLKTDDKATLKTMGKVLDENTFNIFKEEFISLAAGRTTFHCDGVIHPMEGGPVPTAMRLAIDPESHDTWSRVFVVLVDISERNAAEHALRQSEALSREFQTHLTALHDVHITLGQTETLTDLYRQAIIMGREVLGFDRLGLFLADHEHSNTVYGTFGTDAEGNLRDERGWTMDFEDDNRILHALRNKERVVYWEDIALLDNWQIAGQGWNAMAALWDGDHSIGWLATDNLLSNKALQPHQLDLLSLYGATLGHLITRKKSELALRQASEQYARLAEQQTFLLDNMRDFIYRHDTEGNFFYASSAVEQIAGYSPLEWQRNYHELLTDHPINNAVDAYTNATLRNGTINPPYRVEIFHKDGSRVMLEVNERPYYEDDQVAGIIGVARDITRRYQIEQELERYRSHLEDLVEQRTAELQTAYAQLQTLSQMKDEFVSNVSHELRTPIANLKIREHLLRKQPERIDKHLAVMQRETERLERIIEDLLYLSRLDQEQKALKLLPLDLNQMIEQYLTDREPVIAEHGLALHFYPTEDLSPANADEGLIGQLLSILLNNAINYTPAGGQITVRSHQRQDDAGGMWAGFSVADTGPGIPAEEQDHIFERFFRGSIARETVTPGTGLGLAIAWEIVDRHGGRIDMTNTGDLDHGACFRVWLPVDTK